MDHRGVGGVEDGVGADELGDDAAAVDVADEDDGDGGGAGEAHVGDVVGAEVDLGGAAGAFDEEEVGVGGEGGEAVEDGGEEGGLQRVVVAGAGGGEAAALDDDLGAGVGFGLQQDRVHVDGQGAAGGAGLERLGAADLAAVGGDGGVVGHVLRLERGDAEAADGDGAAEAGDEEGFADVGAGALEHQGGGWGGHAASVARHRTGKPRLVRRTSPAPVARSKLAERRRGAPRRPKR